MSAENTNQDASTILSETQKGFSLSQIDSIQDDVLQRLDELNGDILQLLKEFQKNFHDESSS